eukprot:CAMPEP_0182896830 /NCGR_PEP_ID=MMETSP0034_2-20130328/26519_1 /TAXON_ID=156128 /ORGANISM="Nephroselmis pyriformis, Strain CCMP717" /LENGTH=83 /DNA_ID=CAMNT_0025030709 /DNA_START=182 /DNA_END=430 /DNA_ORIENTATION=+
MINRSTSNPTSDDSSDWEPTTLKFRCQTCSTKLVLGLVMIGFLSGVTLTAGIALYLAGDTGAGVLAAMVLAAVIVSVPPACVA